MVGCAALRAVRARDLDAALGRAAADAPSFVADAAGVGTTLYTAPYTLFDPRFGPGSRLAHLDTGAEEIGGALPSLRRDVDDLDDLQEALALGVGPHTPAAEMLCWWATPEGGPPSGAADHQDFLAGAFFVVAFLAADFVAVAFAVVVFLAGAFFAAVVFAVVAFLAGVDLAAVFFAGADFFAAVVFAVVVFLAGVDLAAVFLAGAAFLAAADLVAVAFLVGAAFLAAEAAAAPEAAAFFAAEPDAASVSLGSFFAPETTFFRSAPGLNFGTAFFFALIRSPVWGLRTQRASRTRFSKEPKPVMATFSPLATSRVIVSRTDSSACAAALRFPS